VLDLSDFPKFAIKQTQRGKNDTVYALHYSHSELKKLRRGLLRQKCFCEMATYICLQSIKHVHPKHAQ